jgi:hypothetical protein
VVRVWRIVKDGWRVAMRIEPLRYLAGVSQAITPPKQRSFYPIAKVLQSDEGASAVIGSNMVRAAMCSEVEGSNKIMLPWSLPVFSSQTFILYSCFC